MTSRDPERGRRRSGENSDDHRRSQGKTCRDLGRCLKRSGISSDDQRSSKGKTHTETERGRRRSGVSSDDQRSSQGKVCRDLRRGRRRSGISSDDQRSSTGKTDTETERGRRRIGVSSDDQRSSQGKTHIETERGRRRSGLSSDDQRSSQGKACRDLGRGRRRSGISSDDQRSSQGQKYRDNNERQRKCFQIIDKLRRSENNSCKLSVRCLRQSGANHQKRELRKGESFNRINGKYLQSASRLVSERELESQKAPLSTHQRIKKLSKIQNFLVLVFLTFSILFQTARSTPTSPIELTNASIKTSTISGVDSYYVPDQAWKLAKVVTHRTTVGLLNGLEMQFCPNTIPYTSPVTHCFGISCTTGSGMSYTLDITQIITEVELCCQNINGNEALDHLNFTLEDLSLVSTHKIVNDACLATCSSKFTILGNFVGLAVLPVLDGSDPFINLAQYQASVWDDQCGYIADNLFATTIPDQTILIGDAQLMPTFTTHPAAKACSEVITVTYQFELNTVSEPSWIAYDQIAKKFTISPPITENINKTFTAVITISAFDNMSAVTKTSSFSFNISTKDVNFCQNTNITDKTVNNMSNMVSLPAVQQAVNFNDSSATTKGISTYCGARTYTLFPALPFLNISGTNMILQSPSLQDVGQYNVDLTVSLTDYPGVAQITKNIVITITCKALTINFTTFPAATTLQVGVDTQPINIAFSIVQTPDCGIPVTATFSLSPSQTFLSLQNTTGLGGYINIDGATISDQGTYAQTLTATIDSATATNRFNIRVSDPSRTISEVTGSSSELSSINSADSWYVTTIGWRLSAIRVHKTAVLGEMNGIYMEYCPFSGACTFPKTNCFGTSCTDMTMADTLSFTEQQLVKEVTFCCVQSDSIPQVAALDRIIFTLENDLLIQTKNATNICDDTCSNKVQIEGNFIGMALIHSTSPISHFSLQSKISTCWVDACGHIVNNDFLDPIPPQWIDLSVLVPKSTSSYGQTEAEWKGCPQSFNFTYMTFPHFVTHNESTRNFNLGPILPADAGYDFLIEIAASAFDPLSGTTKTSVMGLLISTYDIQKCKDSNLVDRQINNMTWYISLPKVRQDAKFNNTIEDQKQNYNYCRNRTYTFTPDYPRFLWISWWPTGSPNIVLGNTTNPADAGEYNIQLKISLVLNPQVTPIIKNFVVKIICEVFDLIFLFAPVTIIQIGIDSQPSNISFQITQFPDCAHTVYYVFTPNQAFISLKNPTNSGGNIQISGATFADHGTYSQTFTATCDNYISTPTPTFSFVIKDPCSTAIFKTSPAPLASMNVSLPSSLTSTQTVAILTDVQIAYPTIVCPITAILTPSNPYLSISADFKTLTVNEAQAITPTHLGTNSFTLTVKSATFPLAVSQQTYGFDVIISCQVSSLTKSSQASNATYTLNQGIFETLPFLVTQFKACLFPYTYTHTFLKANVSISQPPWILFDSTTLKFSITITSPANIGVYTITSTATINQVDATGVNRNISQSFILKVQSDCVNTVITDKSINSMSTKISQSADTQDIQFDDLIGTIHENQTYCGAQTYNISPALNFLTIQGTILTLQTANEADVGLKIITLTISLANFLMIPSVTKTFTVEVICEVISIIENQIPHDVIFYVELAQQTVMPFMFTQFPQCNGLTYSLANPKKFIKLDSSKQIITVSTNSVFDKGVYQTQLLVKPLTQGLEKAFDFKVTIVSKCEETSFIQPKPIPNIEVFMQSPEKQQKIVQNFPAFEYLALIQFNYNCGQILTSLQTSDGRVKPQWASFTSDYQITYDLSQLNEPFTQSFNLTASLKDFPHVQTNVSFNLTLSSIEIACKNNKQQTYILSSQTSELTVEYFNKTQTNVPLTPVFESTGLNEQGKEIDLPSFFQFIKKNGTFKIQTNDVNNLNDYWLGLKIYYKEFPNYKVLCILPIKVSYHPTFFGELIVDQEITCWLPVEIKIPTFTDFFGEKTKIILDLGDANSFLWFDPSDKKIKVISNDYSILSEHIGGYNIRYRLIDKMDNFVDQFFTITVSCFQAVKLSKLVPSEKPYVASSNPPKPFIQSINQIGVVRIEFTENLLIPNFDLFPEFKQPGMMRHALDKSESISNNNAYNELNQFGEKQTLRRQLKTKKELEQEAIEIINRGIVVINNTDFPLVELRVIPGIETQSQFLNNTYLCISFKPNYMEFQTYFKHTNQISINEQKETLSVEFNGPQYFRTSTDKAFSKNTKIQVQKQIPRQMELKTGKAINTIANSLSNSSKVIVFVNFLTSSAVQQMLSSMKKMQIMVHLLLMDISIPSQVSSFFNSFLELLTYNIINLEPMTRKFLKLYDDESFSYEFSQLGYSSHFSVINLGSVFLCIMLIPPVLAIVFACKPLPKFKYFQKLRIILQRSFIWDGIISILNENYMVISVSSIVNLKFYSSLQKRGEIFSFTVAMAFMIAVIFYPIFVLVLLLKNYEKLGKEEWRLKFGSFYLRYKFAQGKLQVLEPFFSAVRRLLMILAAIFLKGFPVFQLMICTYSWVATIILNGYFSFVNSQDFFMEQTNEFFIMVLIYHMICFADLVTDETTRGYVGWSMVGFMCLNFLFNFIVILKKSINNWIKSIKLWWWKRKNRILTAKIQKQQENREVIRQHYLDNLAQNGVAEEGQIEEVKYDLGDLNQQNIQLEGEFDSQNYLHHIKKLWENGFSEEGSPKSYNLIALKTKKRNNQKPLAMNQDRSDSVIDELSEILEGSCEQSDFDEESKDRILGVSIRSRIKRSENNDFLASSYTVSEQKSEINEIKMSENNDVFVSSFNSEQKSELDEETKDQFSGIPNSCETKRENQRFSGQKDDLVDPYDSFASLYQRNSTKKSEESHWIEQARYEALWIAKNTQPYKTNQIQSVQKTQRKKPATPIFGKRLIDR